MSTISLLLTLHISIAVASLIITALAAVKPSKSRLRSTAVTIILTIGSGALLAVLDHALILRVCTTGLTYLAIEVAVVGVSVARLRARSIRETM